jgi:hypothetical protein
MMPDARWSDDEPKNNSQNAVAAITGVQLAAAFEIESIT